MKLIVDIEANSLTKPTKIWCIVTKDIDTGEVNVYRDTEGYETFKAMAASADTLVGHNFLGYDGPVMSDLLDIQIDVLRVCDTLIISKLVDYSRKGKHSIEQYGIEFELPKGKFNDFTKWSQELEDYCIRDVEICYRIYNKYRRIIDDPSWKSSIRLEHRFQLICNDLHDNGFYYDVPRAEKLLHQVTKDLEVIDKELEISFPQRLKLIREVTPRATKHGTISKSSIPKSIRDLYNNDLTQFTIDAPFSYCHWVAFNPASHKQRIEVLNEAGWRPVNKTKTHIELEREINRLKYQRNRDETLDNRLKECYAKLDSLKQTGWVIDEENLTTLPETAPAPARLLAKRIMIDSRRRTLTEQLGLVRDDSRIHGKFYGIGAWTHRMAHQEPNMANIPREFKEDGSIKFLGKELRQLWRAPRNRLLVGVDAEGIQLRIFAHYVNDPGLIEALVKGKKSDKSDPHSYNQRILGPVCKTRQAAKRFIYALFLGAGLGRLAQILDCTESEARDALDRILQKYPGFAFLKKQVIPHDAKRGWFLGLDGRHVPIPGDTQGQRAHLCMSGYLQNGEAIIIKKAAIHADEQLAKEKELRHWLFVDIVHDELQSETKNNMQIALKVAKIKADGIRIAGEELGLKCPMAGSYWNDDAQDYSIGTNWYQTH